MNLKNLFTALQWGILTIIAISLSLESTAQQAVLLAPEEPESIVPHSSNIQNTGAAGCVKYSQTMHVMVWDGDHPGFAWEFGDYDGYQLLESDLHDPDVVVAVSDGDIGNDTIFAHFVYERDQSIYYEVFAYNETLNEWEVYFPSTQLSDGYCTHPNIDRYEYGMIAVVWCAEDHYIQGITGDIVGNYIGSPQVVYAPGPGDGDFIEPDVAFGASNNHYGISVTFKEVSDDFSRLWVALYDYFAFSFSQLVGDTLLKEDGDGISYGAPRIAACDHNTCPGNQYAFQIVMVSQEDDYFFVNGYNNFGANPPATNLDVTHHILNEQDYHSQLDWDTYVPYEHSTKQPVVSWLEDIHVAWAYLAPETDTWVIIYRTLDVYTGEPRTNAYGYSYSLVNGSDPDDPVIREFNQHTPCIASRFNHHNEKFIGWFDDRQSTPKYKVRETNTIVFPAEILVEDPGLLYPNPAGSFVNINLPEEEEVLALTVYSIEGREVLQCSDKILDISGLNAGVYVVKIHSTHKTRYKRLIKQ